LKSETRGGDLPGAIDAFGVGGPKLEAQGLRTLVDARELLAMGFGEVLSRLPRVFSALNTLEAAAREMRPDVAIVIDYPDFHFRLAKRLNRLGVPVIYYIPPKVWVWRKKRIQVLRDSFVKVLSILPFEAPFYEKEKVPVVYVGNPLADELPLGLSRANARARLKIASDAKTLVLMPGSRPSELKLHVEVMLDGATRAAALMRASGALGREERLTVLMPFPVTADLRAASARVLRWLKGANGGAGDLSQFILDVRVSQGDAPECLVAADAGLIKSGTSTLEAALLGCPHTIVYKTSRLTEWIFKLLVRYRGPVGLTNLVAQSQPSVKGEAMLVREVLMSDVRAQLLGDELVSLLTDSARTSRMSEGFARIREMLLGGSLVPGAPRPSPSRRAAREVLDVVYGRGSRK
jgi:lipid-A-disaccharide synthase